MQKAGLQDYKCYLLTDYISSYILSLFGICRIVLKKRQMPGEFQISPEANAEWHLFPQQIVPSTDIENVVKLNRNQICDGITKPI